MKRKTKYVLLGLLRDECLTGYELKKLIDSRMSFFWKESYGQIYPELSLLLETEMISISDNKEIKHDEMNKNETKLYELKRDKVRYKITNKGLSEFNKWMNEENEKDTVRSEALLKFFLADSNNIDSLTKQLEIYNKHSEDLLNLYLQYEKQLTGLIDVHDNHKYLVEVLSLGIKQQELYSQWSSEYLKKLKGNKL